MNANITNTTTRQEFDALVKAIAEADDKVENRGNTDEETDRYADELTEAITAVMTYPSPDLKCWARKLELFIKYECHEYVDDIISPMLAGLKADAERFADE